MQPALWDDHVALRYTRHIYIIRGANEAVSIKNIAERVGDTLLNKKKRKKCLNDYTLRVPHPHGDSSKR